MFLSLTVTVNLLFHAGAPYHMETGPLLYRANQWTGLYIIGTSIIKELRRT